jgi:HEAT repeat protein
MNARSLALAAALAWLLASSAALAQAPPPDTRDIETLWKEACLWEVGSNAQIVPAARQALIARGESVLDWLIPARLDTKDTLITRALNVVVTGIGPAAATPRLVAALASESSSVRRNAADLLGALNAREAAPAIAKLLADPDARLGALSALGALKATDTVAAIASLLADEAAPERARVTAAATLGKIGGPDAIVALAGHLGARAAAVRFACQYALQIDEAAPALRTALIHPDPRVRLHAMAALGAIAGPASRAAIVLRLSDPSPTMRGFAAEALARVQQASDAALLRALLARETDPFARGKIEAALSR